MSGHDPGGQDDARYDKRDCAEIEEKLADPADVAADAALVPWTIRVQIIASKDRV